MKTIQEQIQIMTHYLNGGEVEVYADMTCTWRHIPNPVWDWSTYKYRIKEQKKSIAIEKWLCKDNNLETFVILEANNIDTLLLHYYDNISKIKLLETYEVELWKL